jgi:hypothetical protein
VDLNDRIFRHGLDIVRVAAIVNLLVVSVASYRGAACMDSPQFCGQSCQVMHPRIRRLPGLGAFSCGLRGLPHRSRRDIVLPGEGGRHQTAD